ncbi:CYFA0S04e07074g1_1, partial [Cyberlindnera fabianii]
MRFSNLFKTLALGALQLQSVFAQDTSTAPISAGSVVTVTTDLAVATTISSLCGYGSSVGALEDKLYSY